MHHRMCPRRYRFWKFVADIFLLLITHGLWVFYILWRFVRSNDCCRQPYYGGYYR